VAAGLTACGLAALIWIWNRRGPRLPDKVLSALGRVVSLDWFYRILSVIYHILERLVSLLSRVLEGEGGLLWVLVLLLLLISSLVGGFGGG
jgi:hypothetical protein